VHSSHFIIIIIIIIIITVHSEEIYSAPITENRTYLRYKVSA